MIDAAMLESFDRCRRQWQYLERYQPIRITPLGAVYDALRIVMEAPASTYPGPQLAKEHVMHVAGERGVHTDRNDRYDLMLHHAHLAEMLARVLRKPGEGTLNLHPPITGYQPLAYTALEGTRLLRWVVVDHWDDDRQLAEVHGWRTVGDVCVTGLPMTIRVLVIGQFRNGRRYGHWTRARQHPNTKQIRFARRQNRDDGFTESWKTVWREQAGIGVEPWLEQMARDGVLRECAFEKGVRVPDRLQRDRVLDDIGRLQLEMRQAHIEHYKFPMTRSACDSPIHGPCRFQGVCYAPVEVTPDQTGMFEVKK